MELNNENSNRRRVPRRNVDQKVGLLISGAYHIGRCFELGEGGLLVECSISVEVEQKILVTFSIPGTSQAIVRGTVKYVRDSDLKQRVVDGLSMSIYGVEFDTIDFELRRLIRNFVASFRAEDIEPDDFVRTM